MMLADPGRVEADLLGPQRLGVDVLDEVLGRARLVGIAVVAQREVTELQGVSSRLAAKLRRFHLFVNANNEAVPCDPPGPGVGIANKRKETGREIAMKRLLVLAAVLALTFPA